ncbi:MAG: hypothetical protein KJ858_03235, partial [Nanoarchaeota archaeon]|nr:hypothetical protein [Nanoarchaeota archaeon]
KEKEIQAAINDEDYGLARDKIGEFIKNAQDPEIKSNAKLALGELYVAESRLDDEVIAQKLADSHLREGNRVEYGGGTYVDGENIIISKKVTEYSNFFTDGEIIGGGYMIVKNILGDEYKVKKDYLLTKSFGFDKEHKVQYWKDSNKRDAVTIYESIIQDNYAGGKRQFDDSQARLALGQLYLEGNDLKNAEWAYNSVLGDETLGKETIATAHTGLAATYMQLPSEYDGQPRIEEAFKKIGEAIRVDPENQVAKYTQLQLQKSTIETVTYKLAKEKDDLSDMVLEKMGVSGFFTTSPFDPAIWTGDNYKVIYEGKEQLVSSQMLGMHILNEANEGGLSLQDFYNLEESQKRTVIARIVNKETNDPWVVQLLQETAEARQNHDIQLALNDGIGNYDQGIENQFKFKTGKSYIDKEIFESTLGEKFARGVNIKNVLLFAGPGATVKGASLVGWAGRGVGVTSTGAKTVGGIKIIEKAYEIAPKTTRFAGFVSAEAAETGAGIIADTIAPGSGLYVEILSGHAGVFDVVEKVAAKAAIKAPRMGKVFLTEEDELLQGLTFSNRREMDEFLSNVRKNERGLVEIDGKTFVPIIEGTETPIAIAGKRIKASAELEDVYPLMQQKIGVMAANPANRILTKRPEPITVTIGGETIEIVQPPSGQSLRMLARAKQLETELGAQVKYRIEGNKIIIDGYTVPKPDEILTYGGDRRFSEAEFTAPHDLGNTIRAAKEMSSDPKAFVIRRLKKDPSFLGGVDTKKAFGLEQEEFFQAIQTSESLQSTVADRLLKTKMLTTLSSGLYVDPTMAGIGAHVHPSVFDIPRTRDSEINDVFSAIRGTIEQPNMFDPRILQDIDVSKVRETAQPLIASKRELI